MQFIKPAVTDRVLDGGVNRLCRLQMNCGRDSEVPIEQNVEPHSSWVLTEACVDKGALIFFFPFSNKTPGNRMISIMESDLPQVSLSPFQKPTRSCF